MTKVEYMEHKFRQGWSGSKAWWSRVVREQELLITALMVKSY